MAYASLGRRDQLQQIWRGGGGKAEKKHNGSVKTVGARKGQTREEIKISGALQTGKAIAGFKAIE